MSAFLKYLFYLVVAFYVFRLLNRLMTPKRPKNPQRSSASNWDGGPENLEKPKFTIEAESVDYEIIEESKKKNEE